MDVTLTPRLLEVLPISRHRAPVRARHRRDSRRAHPLAAVAITGVALGGSVLTPLTAAAAPAHDGQLGTDSMLDDTTGAAQTEYGYSDDSVYGDSDDDFDSSDDFGSGDSDGGGSSSRLHATHAVTPRTTHTALRASHAAARPIASKPASRPAHHPVAHSSSRTAHTRPMSSGEEQYRNGCRQGYIVEDCGRFDVPHLLQRGINPYF